MKVYKGYDPVSHSVSHHGLVSEHTSSPRGKPSQSLQDHQIPSKYWEILANTRRNREKGKGLYHISQMRQIKIIPLHEAHAFHSF